MSQYDMTVEQWIPVLDRGGGLRGVGLRDALVEAHDIVEVYTDSPIEVIALNRLLLALALRIFPETAEPEGWIGRWRTGRLDAARIDRYLDTWRHRFDLLDPARPFYQHPEPLVSGPSAVSKLFNEEASGNNATLFSHVSDEQSREIDLASAARGVVATQAAAVGGGVSRPFNLSHAPLIAGAVFWMRGHSLFEALMLNAPPSASCRMGARRTDDVPAWERDLPKSIRRVPDGYLDYLTWQSRRLLLEREEHDGRVVVTALRISQGDKEISGDPDGAPLTGDPLMAYRKSREKGIFAYRINADRTLWRDAGLFMTIFNEDDGGGPRTFQWAADEEDELGERRWMIDVFGMATDQAKIELWRRERLPLYTEYLREPNRVELLSGALELAREQGSKLRFACQTVAAYLLFPTKDGYGSLSQNEKRDAAELARALETDERFWSGLEVLFHPLLADLAVIDTTGDEGERRLARWTDDLYRVARSAFTHATSSLDSSARHLRALAEGTRRLGRAGSLAQTASTT
jgi:CRISPR system Cascade subunit CasA